MKTFIKTTLIATILLISNISNAQNQIITFGIKAGLNYSRQAGVSDSKYGLGYNIGLTLDFRASQRIYILTGLEYTVKVSKGDKANPEVPSFLRSKIDPTYLQMPLHVGYMFPISREVRLMVHAGPYAAYGVRGEYKWIHTDRTEEGDYFGIGVGKFDWGLGLGVNAEYNRVVLGLGYDRGLRNFAPDYNEGKARTSNFYLTLGYLF